MRKLLFTLLMCTTICVSCQNEKQNLQILAEQTNKRLPIAFSKDNIISITRCDTLSNKTLKLSGIFALSTEMEQFFQSGINEFMDKITDVDLKKRAQNNIKKVDFELIFDEMWIKTLNSSEFKNYLLLQLQQSNLLDLEELEKEQINVLFSLKFEEKEQQLCDFLIPYNELSNQVPKNYVSWMQEKLDEIAGLYGFWKSIEIRKMNLPEDVGDGLFIIEINYSEIKKNLEFIYQYKDFYKSDFSSYDMQTVARDYKNNVIFLYKKNGLDHITKYGLTERHIFVDKKKNTLFSIELTKSDFK